jgi:hypothetical protein
MKISQLTSNDLSFDSTSVSLDTLRQKSWQLYFNTLGFMYRCWLACLYCFRSKLLLKYLLACKKNSKSDKSSGKMPDYEFPLVSFSTGKEGEENSLSSTLIQLYANLILNTDRSSI